MAKANQAYHKRDLYSDVTARILAELESGATPLIKPWSATPAQTMTLARYYAKQAVKQELRLQGLRPQHIAARLINEAALAYLDQHREELITKACATLTTFEQKRRR